MKRIILLLIGCIFIWAQAGLAKDIETTFDLDGGIWFIEMDGEFQVTEGGVTGTEVDLVSDLGMDEDDTVPNFKAAIRFFNKHNLSLSYFGCDFDGSKNIEQQIDFKGTSYLINTAVSSELELDIIEGRYAYSFFRSNKAELAAFVGIKYAQIKASLDEATAGSKSEEFDAPIPVIGVETEVGLARNFSLAGEIGGISIDVSDIDFDLIDLTAKLNYDFNRNWRMGVGYRYFKAEGSDDDDQAEFSLQGPVLMVTGSF